MSNPLPLFFPIPNAVFDSSEFKALSFSAQAAFMAVSRKWKPKDGGQAVLGARKCAEMLGCGKSQAAAALVELEKAGFISCVARGRMNNNPKEQSPTVWTINWRNSLSGRADGAVRPAGQLMSGRADGGRRKQASGRADISKNFSSRKDGNRCGERSDLSSNLSYEGSVK